MKSSIYVHIASFAGNVGDLVNHRGFYKAMGINEKDVNKIEIRSFYRNCEIGKLEFDEKLAQEINKSNILILGGGGFFDIYWDESSNGTTMSMTKEFVDSIKIPVLVNAMGVHVDRAKNVAIDKFYDYINYIKEKSNWFLSVRNDGSGKRLKELYGDSILDKIKQVPDNGFMVSRNKGNELINIKKKIIGLNITNELFDIGYVNGVTNDQINIEIANFVLELLKQNFCCMFFFHTPQDIVTINKILYKVGEEKFRDDIIIAPYFPFDFRGGLETFIEYYLSCDLIVAMRFHANVIAIANGIPVIGLAIHEQIYDLYEENDMIENCVKIGEKDWVIKLIGLVSDILRDETIFLNRQRKAMRKIVSSNKQYIEEVADFISAQTLDSIMK